MPSQITVTLDREKAEAFARVGFELAYTRHVGYEASQRYVKTALRAALHQTPSGEECERCGDRREVDWTFGNPSPKVPCPDCTQPSGEEKFLPASTVDEMDIELRRNDPEFRARLERSIEENRELLERLGADSARPSGEEGEGEGAELTTRAREGAERLERLAEHSFPSIAEELKAQAAAIKALLPMKLKIGGGLDPAGINDQIYAAMKRYAHPHDQEAPQTEETYPAGEIRDCLEEAIRENERSQGTSVWFSFWDRITCGGLGEKIPEMDDQEAPQDRVAELEAINEGGFDEVTDLRRKLKEMTDARDLCKRQTAQANKRVERARKVWRAEKDWADALAGELDRLRRRKDVGSGQPPPDVGDQEAPQVSSGLADAAIQAERAIDGHMKFLVVSGMAESSLQLYESCKPLADARASIAAAFAAQPAQVSSGDGEKRDPRLGYDLAPKAMRKGLTVRVKLSLHRGEVEGVPISVEDDYCLLDVSGCGTGDPSRRVYWAEMDRFEILPGDDNGREGEFRVGDPEPSTGDGEDWEPVVLARCRRCKVQQPALEKCLCDHPEADKYGDHGEIELCTFVPVDCPSTLTDEERERVHRIANAVEGTEAMGVFSKAEAAFLRTLAGKEQR